MEEFSNAQIFNDLMKLVAENDEDEEDDEISNKLLNDSTQTDWEDDEFDELDDIIEANILQKKIKELEDPDKDDSNSDKEESLFDIMGIEKKEIPKAMWDQEINLIQSAIEQNRKLKGILQKLESVLIVKLNNSQLIAKEDSHDEEEPIKMSDDFYARFATPYFRDGKFPCSPNAEQLMKEKLNNSLHRYGYRYVTWDFDRMSNLEDAIRDKLIGDYLRVNNSSTAQSTEEKQNILDQIINLRNNDLDATFKRLGIDSLDWEDVADRIADGYSPGDCEALWHAYLSPTVNKKAWSNSENKALERIAEANDYRDWEDIAEKLNTNRTGYLCFVQYQRKLAKPPGKWTKEEFSLLDKVIQVNKEGNHINWSKILYYCDGHCFNHLYYKYYKSFNSIGELPRKGKFDFNEDKFIVHAIRNEGLSLNKVSKLMPSRSLTQIRERYTTLARTNRKVGAWTPEEDIQLLKLVEQHGTGNWAKVAKEMKDRTRVQVRQHYEHVQKRLHENPNLTLETYRSRKICTLKVGKPRFKKILNSTKVLKKIKKDKEETDLLKYFAHERKVLEMRQSISSTFELNREEILTLCRMLGVVFKENTYRKINSKPWLEYIYEAIKFVYKQKPHFETEESLTLLPPNLLSFNVFRNTFIRLQEEKNYFTKQGELQLTKEDALFNSAVENWYKRLLMIFCSSLCIQDLTMWHYRKLIKGVENEK